MEIFFQDPNEIPLPPDEVRIRVLKAEPAPDGERAWVFIEVDPFQVPPNLELIIRDSDGRERASASIIESITRKMELTMHIRGGKPDGEYSLSATMYFRERSKKDDNLDDLLEEPNIIDSAIINIYP